MFFIKEDGTPGEAEGFIPKVSPGAINIKIL
jgi:hypothetical protein